MSRKSKRNGTNGAGASMPSAPPSLTWPFSASAGHAPRRVQTSSPPPVTAASPAPAQAPEAVGPSLGQPAPGPLNDAPPPRPAAAAPSPPPPPEDPDAKSSNKWRERVVTRDAQDFAARRPMPQGETMLTQAWLQVIRVRNVPPQACTISMRRSEPAPIYDFYIPGEAVAGAHPDRELFEYVERNRRQPEIAETFVGRIQAQTAAGELQDLGWGHIYLAPRAAQQAGNPWAPPQAPGWGGGAQPAGGAWSGGAPPPQAPQPQGPVMGGRLATCSACASQVSIEAASCPRCGQPFARMGAAPPYVQGAPPAVAVPTAPNSSDPIVLELYKLQIEAHKEMVERLRQNPQPVAAPVQQGDPWTFVERAIRLAKDLQPQAVPVAAAPEGPAVTVHKLDGGGAIVTNRDGVDKDMSTMLIYKDVAEGAVKRISDAISKVKINASVPNGTAGLAAGHAPRRVPTGAS